MMNEPSLESGAPVVFLGPQRHRTEVGAEVERVRAGGRVALITSGWQEWEGDDGWLREAVGGDVVNLDLYRRAEGIWEQDPGLAAAHSDLQQQIRLLRRVYNARLEHEMDAWITVESMEGDPTVLVPEGESALEGVRGLDRQHLTRIESLRADFDARMRPAEREGLRREREAVMHILRESSAIVVAGGQVATLLNRLRLFDLASVLRERPVVAWSAGAMALTERVVLFHDSPPWGPGHAEVGEAGLGLVSGLVALPNGRQRLRLDDPDRVGRMARRFSPDICLSLDPGARAEWNGRAWVGGEGDRLLDAGGVEAWRAVA
jgi:hypothetical protein